MKEESVLKEHGCKACGNKEELVTTVCYSSPLTLKYLCEKCKHRGCVYQSNYQLPYFHIPIDKYYEAKKIAKESKRDLKEVVEELGGTVDLGPEPKYTIE